MAQEWFYSHGDQKLGPVSEAELKRLAAAGELSATDLVWRDGMPDWRPAGRVKGLVLKPTDGPPPIPNADGRGRLQSAGEAVERVTDRVSFLDLKFEQFATPYLIGILFTLALVVLSLTFIGLSVYSLFNYTAVRAAATMVAGVIVYGFMAVCLRVFLELCVVVFRIAEHLSYLRHLAKVPDPDNRRAE